LEPGVSDPAVGGPAAAPAGAGDPGTPSHWCTSGGCVLPACAWRGGTGCVCEFISVVWFRFLAVRFRLGGSWFGGFGGLGGFGGCEEVGEKSAFLAASGAVGAPEGGFASGLAVGLAAAGFEP